MSIVLDASEREKMVGHDACIIDGANGDSTIIEKGGMRRSGSNGSDSSNKVRFVGPVWWALGDDDITWLEQGGVLYVEFAGGHTENITRNAGVN